MICSSPPRLHHTGVIIAIATNGAALLLVGGFLIYCCCCRITTPANSPKSIRSLRTPQHLCFSPLYWTYTRTQLPSTASAPTIPQCKGARDRFSYRQILELPTAVYYPPPPTHPPHRRQEGHPQSGVGVPSPVYEIGPDQGHY